MFWGKRKQNNLNDETQTHLAQQGLPEATSWSWPDHLKRDVIHALRALWRSPGFTVVAVLSLALGIGVNALVFSVVNALALRPLPVEKPENIVFVENANHSPAHSFPNYRELRDRNQSLSGLLGYRIAPMEIETNKGPDRIWGYLATGNYFDVLGIQPAVGRFFHQADDLHPGASPYAVMSYSCWQGRFGGDPNIVGRTVRINRLPFTVLGVAPDQFHGTELFYWPEIWVPMMMQAQIEVGNPWLENRGTTDTWVIGRLKPGVSAAQATADLNVIATDLARQFPLDNEGLQLRLTRPGLVGDALGGPMRAFALGVLVLAGLVLLAACTNLAGLFTARAADRQREIAIRLSLGATRWRIVRQVLTETLVLSLLGGTAGYGLALLLSRLLSQWHAPMDFPVQINVDPDWRVFSFAFAVSLAAGLLFGTAPAGRASRTDAQAVLKGEQRSGRGRRVALRDVLVVLQVALCFVLVAACMLSLRGLQQSLTLHVGFHPQGVSVVAFDVGLAGYSEEQGSNFQRHTLDIVKQLPGTVTAAYSNSIPLSADQNRKAAFSEDLANPRITDGQPTFIYSVSPQFFAAMGIGLLTGRDFDWHDDAASPKVAVVNRAFGTRVLHSDSPLGKRFRFGTSGPLIQVVGVVEDGKYQSLGEPSRPAAFQPMLQSYISTTTLLVKSSMPESQVVEQMRHAMVELDPHLPIYGAGSMRQMLGFAFFPTRAAAIALSGFGLLAIMLAVTGIHGMVSYSVSRRVKEIGIRIAVGATPAQVARLVLGRIMVLMATGAVIGLLLALAAGSVLASIVYEVSPHDPIVLALVVATICLLGLLSSWSPTRRALRIQPTVALRHE